MFAEIRSASVAARIARLSHGRISQRSVPRELLKDFIFLRRVRIVGIGLILLVAAVLAQSPTSTAVVLGTITSPTHKPATNTLVLIAGRKAYTDVGGRYRIDGVPRGPQKIQAKLGRAVAEKQVNVVGPLTVINLQLLQPGAAN